MQSLLVWGKAKAINSGTYFPAQFCAKRKETQVIGNQSFLVMNN